MIGVKNPKPKRYERRWIIVLLQASDSGEAMVEGRRYADSNADADVQWKAFTSMSAAPFTLPISLKDLQK